MNQDSGRLKTIFFKDMPITYTGTLIKLYNRRKRKQVNQIYKIIQLKKIYALTAYNFHNLGTYQIIEIFSALQNCDVIHWDQNKVVF